MSIVLYCARKTSVIHIPYIPCQIETEGLVQSLQELLSIYLCILSVKNPPSPCCSQLEQNIQNPPLSRPLQKALLTFPNLSQLDTQVRPGGDLFKISIRTIQTSDNAPYTWINLTPDHDVTQNNTIAVRTEV